jgi:hypothetical protein
VPALMSTLKNEHTKRILRATGIRPQAAQRGATPHYRLPALEAAGGYLVLDKYRGPEIPEREWEGLTYTTYASDPATFFAPITSATGKMELKGFWEHGKADLDGVWTENAGKCPTLVSWLESTGLRFGRVQLLRMAPNTLRECRWGLHLDNNNQGNPESNGWIVRVWLQLTDARPSSTARGRSRSRCLGTSRWSSTRRRSTTAATTPGPRCGMRSSSASRAAPPSTTGSRASSRRRQVRRIVSPRPPCRSRAPRAYQPSSPSRSSSMPK